MGQALQLGVARLIETIQALLRIGQSFADFVGKTGLPKTGLQPIDPLIDRLAKGRSANERRGGPAPEERVVARIIDWRLALRQSDQASPGPPDIVPDRARGSPDRRFSILGRSREISTGRYG